MTFIALSWLDGKGIKQAQELVMREHYLHSRIASVCSVQGYALKVADQFAGVFLLGRPQAQKCLPWYGSVEEMTSGDCEESRWSVLNLARMYILPDYQTGGQFYNGKLLPGFTDRHGIWRSTLLSTAIDLMLNDIVVRYLLARPPCYLDEPYHLHWCLSYSDPRFHKGTIYQLSGFERYRENARGLVTWRKRLRGLSPDEDNRIRQASLASPRSQRYRQARAERHITQPALF